MNMPSERLHSRRELEAEIARRVSVRFTHGQTPTAARQIVAIELLLETVLDDLAPEAGLDPMVALPRLIDALEILTEVCPAGEGVLSRRGFRLVREAAP